MKMYTRFLMCMTSAIIIVGAIVTKTASACAVTLGETEIPDCLK